MTNSQQTATARQSGSGWLGKISRWWQRGANARTCARIRRKGGTFLGMELLILHTVGRRSGERRESPVSWFSDGDNARLIVASGGGQHHPDWYLNLMANPDQAAIELHGSDPVPATPRRLDGADREQAWQLITAAQPRFEKYQRKSDREYPVIRLTLGQAPAS
jgi:deazaflavin-dependent oxidoreductase (nitroreductase family)